MLTIIVFFLTIISMILMVIKYPIVNIKKVKIQSFWLVTTLGALILLLCNSITLETVITTMKSSSVNPVAILILFICITNVSIILDVIGFFNLVANYSVKIAGGNQKKLFLYIFILVAVLTTFTSNDIIILTLTPFIISFCKKAKINALPYLIMEFVVANTYSCMLIIGNPTNIFIALSFDIGFMEYLKVMFIPTLVGGFVSYIILYLLFKKQLTQPIQQTIIEEVKINKLLLFIGLFHLILLSVLLAISNFINLNMSVVALAIYGFLAILVIIVDRKVFIQSLKRMPLNLIPFILSMFVIVYALDERNYLNEFGSFLNSLCKNSKFLEVIVFGYASIISDSLVNNIPMSLAFTKVLTNSSVNSMYSVVIGSNIGAYLTPIGALAGLMWISILKKEGIDFSFWKFIKNMIFIVLFVSIFMFLSLYVVLLF